MIDEFFERKLDELSEWAPKYFRPRMTRMANSSVGWRLNLYASWAVGGVKNALRQIKSEEEVDTFFKEMEERMDDRLLGFNEALERGGGMLRLADDFCRRQRFMTALLLMLLSALGVCALGTRALGVMALSTCLLWLSTAMETGYSPVCGGLRQRFLTGTVLRMTAVSLVIISEFDGYMSRGVPSNIILQSAMIGALGVHAIFSLGLVVFNTRQPLLLRALATIGGCAPALAAAASLAHAASLFAEPWPLPMAGMVSATGAVMAFLGEELVNIHNLGKIRLKYYCLWSYLLTMGGFTLLIASAWLMGA